MLTVSEAAVKYLSGIVSSQIKGTKIRVFVEHPGTEDADCGVAQEDELLVLLVLELVQKLA